MLATRDRRRSQHQMPVAGQQVLAMCPRCHCQFRQLVQEYTGGHRFMHCPTCGVRYFFVSLDMMLATNAATKSTDGFDYYERPEIENLQRHATTISPDDTFKPAIKARTGDVSQPSVWAFAAGHVLLNINVEGLSVEFEDSTVIL